MLHRPIDGQRIFEAAIYNKVVRALVKENRSHCHYDDQWADVHHHDVVARDESEARAMIDRRYPPEKGFVIQQLSVGGA